ncbi:MAG: TetR/AcrR family transcriptional regulator [Alphaproteobacteria bacterium]
MMSSRDSSFGTPETRHRILEATWRLIERKGVSPRLADVAGEAGISRQAIYLHFGDRAGLMVALVEHIDQSFGKEDIVRHIFDAPSGAEVLDRMIEGLSVYTARVDKVARVLEAAQYQDEAIAAAWRNRMNSRRAQITAIIRRIAGEGKLVKGWSVETAADLCYTVTMPGPWRELTHELGWTPEQYAEHVKRLLRRSFIAD